jgi:hypothetical protein
MQERLDKVCVCVCVCVCVRACVLYTNICHCQQIIHRTGKVLHVFMRIWLQAHTTVLHRRKTSGRTGLRRKTIGGMLHTRSTTFT